MLPTDYHAKVNYAERSKTGTAYRYQTVEDMLKQHNNPGFDVIDSSRMLFDAARLMGLSSRKVDQGWKFTDLKNLELEEVNYDDAEPRDLTDSLRDCIKEFIGFYLFSDFKAFEKFWLDKQFTDAAAFILDINRYLPYAKLGIADEISLAPDATVLQRALACQQATLDRLRNVLLKNAPEDLPDIARESLFDSVLRVNDESVPINAVTA